MPPPTVFSRTLKRVDALLAMHGQVHGTRGRPRQNVSDLLRGTLVLTMAALDAVVLDAVINAVPDLARQGRLGENMDKWVKADPKRVMDCFAAHDPHVALCEVARANLGTTTFQKAEMIEGVLIDTLACPAPWGRAALKMTTTKNEWTERTVKDRLNIFVLRRNRIAHDGDMANESRTTPITFRFVSEARQLVEAVGTATVEEIQGHISAG